MTNWWKPALVALLVVTGLAVIFEGARGGGGRAHPEFTASDLAGKSWSLAEHRGRRPVVLNFFATWCGPCRLELPHLLAMKQKYGDRGLEVVMLTDEDPATVRQFPEFAESGLTVLTSARPVFDAYGVSSIPHTIYFAPDGSAAAVLPGFSEAGLRDLDQRIAALPPAR